jgi:hypothetical protein
MTSAALLAHYSIVSLNYGKVTPGSWRLSIYADRESSFLFLFHIYFVQFIRELKWPGCIWW